MPRVDEVILMDDPLKESFRAQVYCQDLSDVLAACAYIDLCYLVRLCWDGCGTRCLVLFLLPDGTTLREDASPVRIPGWFDRLVATDVAAKVYYVAAKVYDGYPRCLDPYLSPEAVEALAAMPETPGLLRPSTPFPHLGARKDADA